MPLFDDKERTRQDALQRGERLFAYYDGCARNGFNDFRALANAWLTEMPERDQAELIARVRNGTDRDFHASLFELAIHAALIRLGHNVVVQVQPVWRRQCAIPYCGGGRKRGTLARQSGG